MLFDSVFKKVVLKVIMSCYLHRHKSILDKAQVEGRRAQIRMSARQVVKNVSYTGGFLAALASLAARAIPLPARVLPVILTGLTTGLLSGVEGDGLLLKHGNDISYGAGLLMEKNSPFKNIPVLGMVIVII